MPTSALHSPNGDNTKWNRRGPGGTKGLGQGEHCEKKVLVNYGIYAVMMIEQDAFPCGACDNYLKQQTRGGTAIVIRVTEDGTGDRNYHLGMGLAATAGYPCRIYYHNGQSTYNAAPGTWPAAPPV